MKVYTEIIEGHRVLTYRYDVSPDTGFKFHLLSEVGEPWRGQAKALRGHLLRPGERVVQAELSAKPWYVDAIEREIASV